MCPDLATRLWAWLGNANLASRECVAGRHRLAPGNWLIDGALYIVALPTHLARVAILPLRFHTLNEIARCRRRPWPCRTAYHTRLTKRLLCKSGFGWEEVGSICGYLIGRKVGAHIPGSC